VAIFLLKFIGWRSRSLKKWDCFAPSNDKCGGIGE